MSREGAVRFLVLANVPSLEEEFSQAKQASVEADKGLAFVREECAVKDTAPPLVTPLKPTLDAVLATFRQAAMV